MNKITTWLKAEELELDKLDATALCGTMSQTQRNEVTRRRARWMDAAKQALLHERINNDDGYADDIRHYLSKTMQLSQECLATEHK